MNPTIAMMMTIKMAPAHTPALKMSPIASHPAAESETTTSSTSINTRTSDCRIIRSLRPRAVQGVCLVSRPRFPPQRYPCSGHEEVQLSRIERAPIVVTRRPADQYFRVLGHHRVVHRPPVHRHLHRLAEVEDVGRQQQREGSHAARLDVKAVAGACRIDPARGPAAAKELCAPARLRLERVHVL